MHNERTPTLVYSCEHRTMQKFFADKHGHPTYYVKSSDKGLMLACWGLSGTIFCVWAKGKYCACC